MKETKTIYVLICPVSQEVKYVGATKKTLPIRLSGHLADAINLQKKGAELSEKNNWLISLFGKGLRAIIKEIEVTEDWEEKEVFWINYYRENGVELFNQAIGGKSSKGIIPKKSSIEKCIKSKTGVKLGRYKYRHPNITSESANKKRSLRVREISCKGNRKPDHRSKTLNTFVMQLDLRQNLIQEFPNTQMASEITGIKRTNITENLRGANRTAGGFIFKYKNPLV